MSLDLAKAEKDLGDAPAQPQLPPPEGKLLSVAESVEAGFTTVLETPPGSGQLILTSNGKFQGNNTGEVVAQYRVAQLPLLLDHGFGHAVIVGVGTGSSMAMLASQPFESVEVVEMSHDIVDAARRFFACPTAGSWRATGCNFIMATAAITCC